MTRILADLPEEDVRWLDQAAAEQGRSRAAILREAVAAHRARHCDWLEQGHGLWTRFGHGVDGGEYEARVRGQWLRNGAG